MKQRALLRNTTLKSFSIEQTNISQNEKFSLTLILSGQ